MLAASTSGLVDYLRLPGRAVSASPFRQWTAKELVALSTSEPRWYEPGTNWNYSHADFVLLGAALEKITGTRLHVLLQREIMGRSHCTRPATAPPLLRLLRVHGLPPLRAPVSRSPRHRAATPGTATAPARSPSASPPP